MKRPAEVLVVIPTRNRELLLPEAVDSVLAQDYPEVRVVLVDDGSSDGTPAVCRRYAEADPGRILVLRAEGAGCAAARNRGLERMGEGTAYVCFLDDDDRLLPGKIRREVELLEASPEAGFVYGDAILHLRGDGEGVPAPRGRRGPPVGISLSSISSRTRRRPRRSSTGRGRCAGDGSGRTGGTTRIPSSSSGSPWRIAGSTVRSRGAGSVGTRGKGDPEIKQLREPCRKITQ